MQIEPACLGRGHLSRQPRLGPLWQCRRWARQLAGRVAGDAVREAAGRAADGQAAGGAAGQASCVEMQCDRGLPGEPAAETDTL